MTFGPIGNTAGLSGSQNDAASQVRRTRAELKSEKAAGLGAADADSETSDRDADGRRIWEIAGEENEERMPEEEENNNEPPKAKDPTGNSGGLLDLTG